tara:strand:- start:1625 stop:1960 length:336 start_codon:yes stop_codon:yes gene_type:complete
VNSCWDYFHNNNHNFDHLLIGKINKYIVEIIAFIKKPLMVELIITNNPHLEERYNYPLDTIREIIINTLVDRDYRDSNVSIIKIYDDKIEFYNPEGLYDDLTDQELLKFNY